MSIKSDIYFKLRKIQTRQMNTYFLYTKKGRGFQKIIGPIFESEIPTMRETHFLNKKSYVIEESAFATQYSIQYHNHLQKYWIDKLYCYFAMNASWIGYVKCSYEDQVCKGSWFTILETTVQEKDYDDEDFEGFLPDDPYLQINFTTSANPFYVARFKQDLLDMNLHFIKVGEEYYEDKVGKLHVGTHAISRQLASDLIDHMCLS